jgi:hypothetical protein
MHALLRSESDLFSIVVIGNYFEWAGNEAHSGESYAFSHPSMLVGPMRRANEREIGGAAGIRTRVRSGYYTRVYRHRPPKRTHPI